MTTQWHNFIRLHNFYVLPFFSSKPKKKILFIQSACFLISTNFIPSNNSSFNFLSSINRCSSRRGHNCLLVRYHLNLWLNCAPYSVLSLSLFSKEHEWVMNDHSQGRTKWRNCRLTIWSISSVRFNHKPGYKPCDLL